MSSINETLGRDGFLRNRPKTGPCSAKPEFIVSTGRLNSVEAIENNQLEASEWIGWSLVSARGREESPGSIGQGGR